MNTVEHFISRSIKLGKDDKSLKSVRRPVNQVVQNLKIANKKILAIFKFCTINHLFKY